MNSSTTLSARLILPLSALGLPLLMGACSGSGGGGSGGDDVTDPEGGGVETSAMTILSCSLGCSGGIGGSQISCGITQIFVNQEISILFSRDVDLSSVTKSTFQVTQTLTGKSPAGAFSLDPVTPGRLIFRPQLTFDSTGAPIFGLKEGFSYLIKVPGALQGDLGPFIQSTDGKVNQARLECTIAASGVLDAVPGPPSVQVLVDVATFDAQGEPTGVTTGVSADDAVDVSRNSDITLLFDDVMNPVTLVNPVTGVSNFLSIRVDPDGNLSDTSDQVELLGSYTIDIDQDLLATKVTFAPDTGLPSGGTGLNKRKILVEIPVAVIDLGNNPLTNAGTFAFTPEVIDFDPVSLPAGGEDFTTTLNRDKGRTGSNWSDGTLTPGPTGGSGYLGELQVVTAENLVLVTESDASAFTADFPTATNTFTSLDVIPLGDQDVVPGSVPSITIEDGVFAFSEVQVQAGGVLRFLGSNPARLYVAGQMEVKGVVDCSGDEPAEDLVGGPGGHASDLTVGGSAGLPGPGGGAGGAGADRFDYTGNLQMLGVGGVPNPGAVTDGQAGGPVGNDPSLGGQGPGGSQFPPDFPVGLLEASWGGFVANNLITCSGDQMGAAGGGGAYVFPGGIGVAVAPLLPSVLPPDPPTPDTPGGDNSGIPVGDPQFRKLHPEDGNLNGGSGGGGGGAGLHTTKTNGQPLQCFNALGGGSLQISLLFDHSGAGGGGAGGALQINASNITIDGLVTAEGGKGGDSLGLPSASQLLPNNNSAAPGGGGSGGALLLQAVDLVVADTPGRISIAGGEGGSQNSPVLSLGGDGSTGLVRFESDGSLDPLVEAQKILPFDEALSPASSEFLSIGSLEASQGEALLSAAQSCWLKPVGNFFQVQYADDDLSDPLNPVPGWDMDLVFLNSSIPLVSYRGNNPLLPPGQSFETFFGTDLKGTFPAPLVVRFQGVRAVKSIEDFCNVDLSSDTVIPGSLTGWVRHPADLNSYWLDAGLSPQAAEKLRPNMLRFRIVFDDSTATPGVFSTLLQGITNFRITAQPD